jgi:hypothetical protein
MKIIPVLSAIATSAALVAALSAIAKAGDSNCANGNCDVNSALNGGSKPSNSSASLQPTTNIGNSNNGQAYGTVGQSQNAFMSNYQINNQPVFPEYGFGPGISCPETSLSITGYTGGGGTGGVYSFGDTISMGGAMSINIPLGSTGKICREMARTIVLQRRLDTCIGIHKSELEIDYAKVQALGGPLAKDLELCQLLKNKTVVVVPVPDPEPVPVTEPVSEALPVYKAPPIRALY